MSNLLPPNATPSEHALDDSTARIGAVPVDITKLWNPDSCPAALLPWLAWGLSVDEWDESWSEAQKRAVVASSYRVHAHKGTPQAIIDALAALGFDNIDVYESNGGTLFWPLFDVALNIGQPPSPAMTAKLKATVERYKNVRSVLRGLLYFSFLYNNTITYDGTYNHDGGVL